MSTLFATLNGKVIKRFPPGVWLLMALNLFITIAFSIAMPFLALYLHNVRGLSMSIVGTIFLVSGLCNAGTNVVGGMLSDRLGRRRLLLTIMVASVFAYGTLAALTGVMAPVWLIAIVYVAARSVLGTINPTVSAIAADLSPRDRLTETYAFIRIGGNVGFSLGPAMGGYLLTFLSYGWLVSVSAAMCIVAAALTFFFLRESFAGAAERADFRSTIAVARDRPFLIFIIFSVLLMLSISHLGSTLSVFSVDRMGFSASQYGLLLTTNGVMVVVAQYPVAWAVNKLGKATGLIAGSLFYAAGYFTLGWITSFRLAIVSMIIITTGEVVYTPISSAVVAEQAPPDKRGRYMGFFALAQTLGYSFAPLFGGVLLDTYPSNAVALWGIIASVSVVAAGGFAWWGIVMRRKTAIANAELYR